MVTTDPIADMLARIRNAVLVNKSSVSMPHSKIKENVAKILKQEGFVHDVKSETVGGFKRLQITINEVGSNAKISDIQRVSKPGRRLYSKASDIPVVMNGRGMVILSTSQGIMPGDEARRKKMGGELICQVY